MPKAISHALERAIGTIEGPLLLYRRPAARMSCIYLPRFHHVARGTQLYIPGFTMLHFGHNPLSPKGVLRAVDVAIWRDMIVVAHFGHDMSG